MIEASGLAPRVSAPVHCCYLKRSAVLTFWPDNLTTLTPLPHPFFPDAPLSCAFCCCKPMHAPPRGTSRLHWVPKVLTLFISPFLSFSGYRTPSYSPLLLTHAWSNKDWVQSIERQLAAFLSAKGSKRQSLPAMPRHQREVVHALAEQFGLASSSYKPEPGRYVELFKLPASSIPNK